MYLIVKVDGKRWSAISTKKIKVGRKVEILSIDGVKLHVKEVEEKEKESKKQTLVLFLEM